MTLPYQFNNAVNHFHSRIERIIAQVEPEFLLKRVTENFHTTFTLNLNSSTRRDISSTLRAHSFHTLKLLETFSIFSLDFTLFQTVSTIPCFEPSPFRSRNLVRTASIRCGVLSLSNSQCSLTQIRTLFLFFGVFLSECNREYYKFLPVDLNEMFFRFFSISNRSRDI